MANTLSNDQVLLTIPMRPDMELAAAKLASVIAESMSFDDDQIEEIQLAMIESCINAFEHSRSPDQMVIIKYIMRADELEFKITDQGVGFSPENRPQRRTSKPDLHPDMRKRGWGLEIIHALMDSVDIMSGENGTTISMVKCKTV
ncbi:ATP-binding protein [Candidatus Poribacteria bacterium]|nr:ATP-binding protein [Candidatus Poribacteria bacterium]